MRMAQSFPAADQLPLAEDIPDLPIATAASVKYHKLLY
jgi:hypothetical protein